jgi:hypothetical protein
MEKAWNKVIEEINDIDGIEKIIWAFSGAKRCSDFKIKDEKDTLLLTLDSLGLNYDGTFVKVKDWPSWEVFARKCHKSDDYMFDLATGLFYDIPCCCAKAYQQATIKSYNKFFADHPFKGKTTLKEVLKLSRYSSSFYDELGMHEKIYDFKKIYDVLYKSREEVIQFALSSKVPESLFLLLGQTYVPCEAHCDKFLSKSEQMLRSMTTYLGDERTKQILKEYKQETITKRE